MTTVALLTGTAMISLCMVICQTAVSAQDRGTVRFTYDENGRLKTATLPTGETVEYEYDSGGNITAIKRRREGRVSIFSFSPTQGPPGTIVTIRGMGFDPDPSLNEVRFNGVAASVLGATSQEIVARAPAGASSGPISIRNPDGTAESSVPFIVTGGPLITAFSPRIGSPGGVAELTGENFDVGVNANLVEFNLARSLGTNAGPAVLEAVVPPDATSGRIRVTTSSGVAVSRQDFFVAPPPHSPGEVSFAERISVGDSVTVQLGSPGSIGLVVFDMDKDSAASLKVSESSINDPQGVVIRVIAPFGSELASFIHEEGSDFLDSWTAPLDGAYTLLVSPSTGFSGSLTVRLFEATLIQGRIDRDQPAMDIVLGQPGQNAILTFDGDAGDRVQLEVRNLTLPLAGVTLLGVDGSRMAPEFFLDGEEAVIDIQRLPETGTYTLFVDPVGEDTGSFSVRMVGSETGAIVPGGPPVFLVVTFPEDDPELALEGRAGQRISLLAESLGDTGEGEGQIVTGLMLFDPGGGALMEVPSEFTDAVALSLTGRHRAVIRVFGRGFARVQAFDVPEDFVKGIDVDGDAVSGEIVAPGQNGSFIFEGTEGERVSLVFSGTDFDGLVSVTRGGTHLASSLLHPSSISGVPDGYLENVVLPSTGEYTVIMDPFWTGIGRVTARLYRVPQDTVSRLLIDGPPVTVTTTAPGQNAALLFAGGAGRRISVTVRDIRTTFLTDLRVFDPAGNLIGGSIGMGSGELRGLLPTTLSSDGDYTIIIDPRLASTGSLDVAVHEVDPDLDLEVETDGVPHTISIDKPGQKAFLRFSAEAGKRISLKATGVTDDLVATVDLRAPSGLILARTQINREGGFMGPISLGVDGRHSVEINPFLSIGQARIALHEVPPDVEAGLAIGGPSVTVELSTPGQRALLSLNAESGQSTTLLIGQSGLLGSRLNILRPDGSVLTSVSLDEVENSLSLSNLPMTGVYRIVVFHPQGETGSLRVEAIP